MDGLWGSGMVFFSLFCWQFPENLSSNEASLPIVIICECWRPCFTEKPWVFYISGDEFRDPATDAVTWMGGRHSSGLSVKHTGLWQCGLSGKGSESSTLGVEFSRGVMRWPRSRGGAPSLPLIRRKLQFSQFKGSSRRHWSCDYKSLLLFWLHSGLSISLLPLSPPQVSYLLLSLPLFEIIRPGYRGIPE